MAKFIHEIRDPIHVFIRLDSDEREVLNSRPYQRLRHIHQLGLTYLLYPGATHRRFEHCLGVMELSSRVYDKVTDPNNIHHDSIKEILPKQHLIGYWRCVLRMAALCHDLGHFPFSHAAESLVEDDLDHEDLTKEIILSDEMKIYWEKLKINPIDVAKIAVGPKKFKDIKFSDWEAILSEIITSDCFGVDRMDYLLRDSHHSGVAYGKFDHYRLIDTLRILPKSEGGSTEPVLGIEAGGIYSAEALILARYFMYTQLYFHAVRRIYDLHLKDFLIKWLDGGRFSKSIDTHLQMTDNEVTAEILKAATDSNHSGHLPANRIVNRKHFREIYSRNPVDMDKNPESATLIYDAMKKEFGDENLKYDSYTQKGSTLSFPVFNKDRTIMDSSLISKTLKDVPIVAIEYIFIEPSLKAKAQKWLEANRTDIIKQTGKEEIE